MEKFVFFYYFGAKTYTLSHRSLHFFLFAFEISKNFEQMKEKKSIPTQAYSSSVSHIRLFDFIKYDLIEYFNQ